MPNTPTDDTGNSGDTGFCGNSAGAELAILEDGPAHGLHLRVTDRPPVVQVTHPCEVEGPSPEQGLRAEALYVYRRDLRVENEPLRYGFDRASP